MKEHRLEIALTGSNELKFMLNIPNEELDANILKFGYINNVIPNLSDKSMTVDFGVQYSYKDEPILECRYAFVFKYNDFDEGEMVSSADNGININDDLLKIIINVAAGSIRGIMIAKTAGTALAKYPLPILDLQSLIDSVSLLYSE